MTQGDRVGVENRPVPWHGHVLTVTSGTSIAVGLLVMAGWHLHSTALIQLLPMFVPMQYNTALGFLLCGIGIFSAARGKRRLAVAMGAVVGALGILTLGQYIFGLNLGIDQLLMTHYVLVETSHPGRMAPNTALTFVLVAAALLILVAVPPFKGRPLLVGSLSALILTLGGVAFIGYLTGASTAYGWGQLTNMAVHTAAGFMVLGTGILMAAYQEGLRGRSEPVDVFTMPRWNVFFLAALLMTAVTFSVVLNVMRELNHIVVEQKQEDLLAMVNIWAESMASPGGDETEALRHAGEVYERLNKMAGTGAMALGRYQGDEMVLLLSTRQNLSGEGSLAVPVDSILAKPMGLALLGQSGTIIQLDDQGEEVLAAYTPFAGHGWGLVGTIDMGEVRAPLIRASMLASAISVVIVLLSSLFILVVFDPMLRRLASRTTDLAHEVKEHRRAEEALRRSESRFRHLFEKAPVSLWEEDFSEVHRWVEELHASGVENLGDYLDHNPEAVHDAAGLVRVLAVNQATLDLLKSSSVEDLTRSLPRHFTPNSTDVFKAEIVALDERIEEFSSMTEVRTTGGEIRTVMLNLFVDLAVPDWRRVYVSMMDITEMTRAEEELRRSEHIISQSSDMLALVDVDFTYRVANPSYLRAFNKSGDVVVGRTVTEVFGPEFFRRVIEPMAVRCLAGESMRYQEWFDFPVTGQRYMDIAYSPYFGSDEQVQGMVVAARDVTERKEAEDLLEKHLAQLEETVLERTADLRRAVNLMAGREVRMAELKISIQGLRKQLRGVSPPGDPEDA